MAGTQNDAPLVGLRRSLVSSSFQSPIASSDEESTERQDRIESKADIEAHRRPRSGIFISYSHRDRQWLDLLKTALKPFERQGTVHLWDDTRIRPGAEWKQEIEAALQRVEAAILLVSQDFLASDFINQTELPALLSAAEQDGLQIFWLPVRPSTYEHSALGRFQAAIDPSTPLSTLDQPKQELVLVDFVKRLQANLEVDVTTSKKVKMTK